MSSIIMYSLHNVFVVLLYVITQSPAKADKSLFVTAGFDDMGDIAFCLITFFI